MQNLLLLITNKMADEDKKTNGGDNQQNGEPLRSVHTTNLPQIFDQLGISLVVSTYQAGRVIIVRNDGGTLNTHFRNFNKPMGIAGDYSRLTIGGTNTVWYYRNVPAVAHKIEPENKHDACFLPRRIHVTGDIDIHEMAYDGDNELWIVNTRFCCLCTLDRDHILSPLEALFCYCSCTSGPVPPKRTRHGRWQTEICNSTWRNRYTGRMEGQ